MKRSIREKLINRHFSAPRWGGRRLLSIGVSALLSISTFLTVIPQTETIVYAEDIKAIALGKDNVASNIKGEQKSSIYFGNYPQSLKEGTENEFNTDPIEWKVLKVFDLGGGHLFLLSDQNLDAKEYHNDNNAESITWKDSSLRVWMNNDFKNTAFSEKEKAVIIKNYRQDPINTYFPGINSGGDTEDSIVALSIDEVSPEYGFTSEKKYQANNTAFSARGGREVEGQPDTWWLRSPGDTSKMVAYVTKAGKKSYSGKSYNNKSGVRPAMNIMLNSIILTSAAEDGKKPGSSVGILNEVASYTGKTWKLTVLDESRNSFTAYAGTDATVSMPEGYTSWTVPIVYSGAQTGDNEHVSAILTDSRGNVLYYGHIECVENNTMKEEGEQSVTIPGGLCAGTYTLKVFNEQVNGTDGDYATDLSSELTDAASLTVIGKASAPTFSPEAGTYLGTQQVTLNSSTPDATIYYTTDGTDPTDGSMVYNSPISVTESTTVRAIAVKDGMPDSVISQAKYTIKCRIKFDPNGGSGKMADQTVEKGKETKLDANNFTYSGYDFTGWNTKAGGKGKSYKDQADITPDDDLTLYAQWKKNTYDIDVTNDGHGTAKANKKSAAANAKIALTAEPKAGYKFKKWTGTKGVEFKKATSAETSFKMPKKDVTVKANFEKISGLPFVTLVSDSKNETKLNLKWKRVKEADGYDIFFEKCNGKNEDNRPKLLKTIRNGKTTKYSVSKLGKKKLGIGVSYRACVKAFVWKNKKKTGKIYIGESPLVHACTAGGTKKNANAESVTVKKTEVSIKKGKTMAIKATVKSLKRGKKVMPSTHVATVRYLSTDKKIAAVDENGVITAKKKGDCTIYAFAHNGVYATVDVSVR